MEKINNKLEYKYVVVYWDHQNIPMRTNDGSSLAEDIVSYTREEGTIARLEVFADWTHTRRITRERLRLAGFRLIQVDNIRPNVLDFVISTELGSVAMDRSLDAVILVTSDGDFVPAITLLKRSGKEVTVIGNPAISSKDLTSAADKFLPVTMFSSWRRKNATGEEFIEVDAANERAVIS